MHFTAWRLCHSLRLDCDCEVVALNIKIGLKFKKLKRQNSTIFLLVIKELMLFFSFLVLRHVLIVLLHHHLLNLTIDL